MKKWYAAILAVVGAALLSGCAGVPPATSESTGEVKERRETSRGVVADWKVAPLQTTVWYDDGPLYLFDGEAIGLLILDPFSIGGELHSGIISLTGIYTQLKNNFGLHCGIVGVDDLNCGISCGIVGEYRKNYALACGILGGVGWNYGLLCGPATWAYWNNYGVQVGVLNASGGGAIQICGVNIADRFGLAAFNWTDDEMVAVGVFNAGKKVKLQIGLLNYNHDAPIPLFPFFNCCP